MNSLELLKTSITETKQNINLVDGSFTPSQASDVINALLDTKINFHKLKRLSITEGNINDVCEYDNSRIVELIEEKGFAKEFFSEARLQGKKLKLKSTISICIEE